MNINKEKVSTKETYFLSLFTKCNVSLHHEPIYFWLYKYLILKFLTDFNGTYRLPNPYMNTTSLLCYNYLKEEFL